MYVVAWLGNDCYLVVGNVVRTCVRVESRMKKRKEIATVRGKDGKGWKQGGEGPRGCV